MGFLRKQGKNRVNYKGTPISITADHATEMLQARRKWKGIFKVLKGENQQPSMLYPLRIGERKNFSEKQKIRIQQY